MFRTIIRREAGFRFGSILRLIDPQGLGQVLKPFVFLDYFFGSIQSGFGFGLHPHSGIATLTWQPDTDVAYEDTTGQSGVLRAGGLEWMNAGGGAWHQGHLLGSGHIAGFQLWVAMPPGVENSDAVSQYVPPPAVPSVVKKGWSLTVLLGEFDGGERKAVSPVRSHHAMNYFVLSLEQRESWCFHPPEGHEVAWAFVFDGQAKVQGEQVGQELLVLSHEGKIECKAEHQNARILIGTSERHRHPLVVGPYSVHTSASALRDGHQRINEIGRLLREQGKID